MSIARTRLLATSLTAAAVGLVASVVLPATSAQATGYVYWSYWHGTSSTSTWSYSSSGAGGYRVTDGDVEGWRFAVSPDSSAGVHPRTTPSTAFAQACGSVAAGAGQIRVAVVVDQGVAADRPAHSIAPAVSPFAVCKVLDASTEPNGLDILAAAPAQQVRYGTGSKTGFVCGIDGYPSVGCGGFVDDPTPSPSSTATHDAGTPTGSPNTASVGSIAHSSVDASLQGGTSGSEGTSTAGNAPGSALTADNNSSTITTTPVASPSPSASGGGSVALAIGNPSPSSSGGGSAGLLTGLVAIAAVGGAAAVVAVRRLR